MDPARRIALVIADDHALVRSGLRLLLETQSDFRIVGEAGTHRDLLGLLDRHRGQVDVVTLDISMPGGPAAALIHDIASQHQGVRIVVLTMHEDPAYARLVLAAGAGGYVVKSAADTELIAAIRTVAQGGMHCTISGSPRPGAVPGRLPAGESHPAIDALSEREREVLVLVAKGHTSQQIADSLFLSVKTVESYRSRLMTKLGVKGRSELTRLAIETGLLGG